MSVVFNPLSGNFETKEPGPKGDAGTVSAAGDGSEAIPSISFASDTNTGIYKYAPDAIGFATNGAGRVFIDSGGKVGSANPSVPLTIIGPASSTTDYVNPILLANVGTNTNGGHRQGEGVAIGFRLKRNQDGSATNTAFIKAEAEADLGSSYPTALSFGTQRFGNAPVKHMLLDSEGNLKLKGILPSLPNISLNSNGSASFVSSVTIGGIAHISNDIRMSNGIIALSYVDANNIDHIWHDETNNTFIFNSDTTSKNTAGTGNIKAANITAFKNSLSSAVASASDLAALKSAITTALNLL